MVNSYRPASLAEALEILNKESVVPYSGGTDIMINPDEHAVYLFINKIPELRNIAEEENWIRIGAACTFAEMIENDLTPGILKEAARQVAAPAIRNIGTVGGNICNGSPKGDCALALAAADAGLRLAGSRSERIIPISEFYLGGKKTDRHKDELLVEILVRKKGINHYCFRKVGPRNALAIAKASFAGVLEIENGIIIQCRVVFGAISGTIIMHKEIDAMLAGKTIQEARELKQDYLEEYDRVIVPIEGRTSAEYRKAVCMNLLKDFLEANGI